MQPSRGVTDREGVDVPETNRDLEKWLPVVGCEGRYSVSDQGRIRLDAMTFAGLYLEAQILDQRTMPKGYKVVSWEDGGGKTVLKRVHRLVLEAFVGPCPSAQEGCHENGDPGDNRRGNLYWGTKPENALDQVRHGTHFRANLTHCPYEHALADPNLITALASKGKRKCWSCYVIRQRNNYEKRCGRPALDHKIESDKLYAALLESDGAIRRS